MADLITCPECKGDGELDFECSCWGMPCSFNCSRCGNSGVDSETCTTCEGEGEVDPDEIEEEESNA